MSLENRGFSLVRQGMISPEDSTPYVTNAEIARILFHVASILETTQDNIYRVRAYRRAALGILMLQRPLAEYVLDGEEAPLPGVGDRIRGRLKELVNTGQMGVYAALLEDVGEPVVSLLALYGVGPKTAMRLVSELKLNSLQDLVDAAHAGKIRELRGFGKKREAQLAQRAEALLHAA